jgi:hypothetical protein
MPSPNIRGIPRTSLYTPGLSSKIGIDHHWRSRYRHCPELASVSSPMDEIPGIWRETKETGDHPMLRRRFDTCVNFKHILGMRGLMDWVSWGKKGESGVRETLSIMLYILLHVLCRSAVRPSLDVLSYPLQRSHFTKKLLSSWLHRMPGHLRMQRLRPTFMMRSPRR